MTTPVIAQRFPVEVEVVEGETYWWCACGRSKGQPFCDGSHQGTTITPMQWTAARSGKVWLCGCKHSNHKPLCDGSHKTLPEA